VFLKCFLCRLFLSFFGYINTWVFVVAIFQINYNISQELVIFREHGNDRNFKSVALQVVTSVHDHSPFLSDHWQMSLKRFSSSTGRWLSIGMQYLKTNEHR